MDLRSGGARAACRSGWPDNVPRRVRRPAVAGVFYPADAESLAGTVDRLLASVPGRPGAWPAAMVVPHAGYRYSGPVAATGYARLAASAGSGRFVLLGPAHFVRLYGLAASDAEAWRTPLGEVAIDIAARDLAGLPADDGPHSREHALEVQLPFLQRLISTGLTVLPVAVGRCPPALVADALDRLLASGDMVVLVSTDLSHYYDDATARRRDARTAAAILARDPAAIRDEDACGAYALRGLLTWAVRHEAKVCQLDLRTSAETGGDPERVVGYGAFELIR